MNFQIKIENTCDCEEEMLRDQRFGQPFKLKHGKYFVIKNEIR